MSKAEVTTPEGTSQILITREVAAPAELVFRAFTEPELMAQWLGPRRLEAIVERNDARDGGRWLMRHREPDGTEHVFHGVHHGDPSVAAGIVRTFEWAGLPGHVSLEAITFSERDGTTTIHQNAVYQSVADRDGMAASGMEEGMNEAFDRLDELVAGMPVSP